MSHKAVAWAIEQSIPSLQKLVLIMLSERHNRDTGRCDPSIVRLGVDCGMSKGAIRAALDKLAERGLLQIVRRSDGERQISNFYRLAFDGLFEGGGSTAEGLGGSTAEGLGGSTPEGLPLVHEKDGGSPPEGLGVVHQKDGGVVHQKDTNHGSSFNHGNRTREGNPGRPPDLPAIAPLVLTKANPAIFDDAIARGAAQPVNPTPPDLSDLAAAIICAHPKAIQRAWAASDVPWAAKVSAVEAMQAEADKAGCNAIEAGLFILAKMQDLAKRIPQAEWRFLKRPEDFIRARDYRLDVESFIKFDSQPTRSFADESAIREEEEIRRIRSKRTGERIGSA